MNKNTDEHWTPVVLIVDDMPANVQMVSMMLKDRGYKVRVALGGEMALQSVRDIPPDLLLLDINMPGMDGYEVCRQLKADEKTKGIPVIFISSLSETMDKLKAFQAGGVDYVEKPFHLEEVFARVETHLKIRELQRELSLHNQRLEEVVHERTCQLEEASRRLAIMDKTKSEFLNLISHELRTPLNGIFGVAQLLFDENETDPERRELMNIFSASRNTMMKILDDALLLTQIQVSGETFSSHTTPLDFIIKDAISSLEKHGQPCNTAVLPKPPHFGIDVHGDSNLLVKAFSSLLETAAKFSSGEPLDLTCKYSSKTAEIAISAKGRTIPADMLADFFEVFSASRPIAGVGELGLGPPVAQRILSLFDGSVAVKNEVPAGVTFILNCKTGK